MNQEKIGKLIAECRKEKKMTQTELANKLGVTDKSISKWENGKCLPDVSLYKELCSILNITLNEFFVGEKIPEEKYKEVADDNLFYALEDSAFTLEERIKYFEEKWNKEHIFYLIVSILIVAFIIVFGFVKQNGLQYVGMILGFVFSLIENNTKKAYVERNAYKKIKKD